ncbi:Fe2+-dependent dioxygenase [Acinetobacter sp. SK-43]|uniref:Fe2+-dependent dioxygenase n=1 Tax=Acinetobacter junii TaxID=40215 RepID=A0AAX1MLZ6_ACIJU|nr:Fe2+-dependent dioxygenase [Acinetobacter sp. SK-43]MQZ58031.1 Fe2+-dependent dioxygenase [Acinetobacter junii]QUY38110.1 Fe2+-dependent dioxygenase [Acinetobacter junii]RSE30936.1 Fe2+-dependent dioxygenase [Acinetobacter junii]RXS99424.1 Fe2+-dependent dioxygenase [Acinetobacter junii]
MCSVIHHIPNVLTKEQVAEFRKLMEAADWVGGKITAGTLSASVKRNQQLSESDPLTHQLSALVMDAIWKNPTFQAAALPKQMIPPLFNRYDEHESFGFHVDNSIRLVRGTHQQLRTDLSCTLFLSEPEEYDGGDLVIEDTYGYHEVKLPAGDVVLYPSTSLHEVSSITRGTRFASFFWVQSLIRDDQKRHMLFNLDESIRQLRIDHGDAYPEVMKLTNIYHNLIRMWSEL